MKNLALSSGFVFHSHSREDIDEYIRLGLLKHKELGFASVDFDMGILSHMGDDVQRHLEKAINNARKLGIVFGVCHLPFVSQKSGHPNSPEFKAKMFTAIDAAKMIGAEYAVMHPNSTTVPLDTLDRTAEYDNVMTHLSPFAEYAGKVGVRIAVENMRTVHQSYPAHRYCANPDELCAVADALGAGVCWDTGHANITGLKQSEAIAQVGKRLKMVHLNDNFADDDVHIAPFCGSVDWADVMKGLSDIGFDGYLNFEVSSSRIPANLKDAFGRYVHAAGIELLKMM